MKMTAEHVFEIIRSIICVPRSHREELMRVLRAIPYEDDGIEHDWQLAECELQIVREVALGLSNREIAEKLKMGETTSCDTFAAVSTRPALAADSSGDARQREKLAALVRPVSRDVHFGALSFVGEHDSPAKHVIFVRPFALEIPARLHRLNAAPMAAGRSNLRSAPGRGRTEANVTPRM